MFYWKIGHLNWLGLSIIKYMNLMPFRHVGKRRKIMFYCWLLLFRCWLSFPIKNFKKWKIKHLHIFSYWACKLKSISAAWVKYSLQHIIILALQETGRKRERKQRVEEGNICEILDTGIQNKWAKQFKE